MPDAEMSEDINVRIAGQATSPGLVVYHLQRVTRDRIALRRKILRPVENDRRKWVRLWNTSQSGEVAGRLLSTALIPQGAQDSGRL
jgi:hypothetical protein